MTSISIYQIYYDQTTMQNLDPGFIALDNLRNQRSDWREYWPIRSFLLTNPKMEGYVGFFSPKFREKTGLVFADIEKFANLRNNDVMSFSPFIDQSAFYQNIFQHGDANHPGLMSIIQEFVYRIGYSLDVSEVWGDHRYFIFSNFFIATPKFWRLWFRIAEMLFVQAEHGTDAFAKKLNEETLYRDGVSVSMKVFIMERIASLLLHIYPELSVAGYPAFSLPTFGSKVSKFPKEMAICNAMKSEYMLTLEPIYRRLFEVYKQQALIYATREQG
jgi:hypothetical protein